MGKRRSEDRGDVVRRMLAYQEERMLLYRELAAVNESLLADLVHEVIRPPDVLASMEKEMSDLGIIAKQHDV